MLRFTVTRTKQTSLTRFLCTACLAVLFTGSVLAVDIGQSAKDGFDPNVNGTVYATVVQGDGKILIGGEFTTVGGVTRFNIARLNVDGSLDASFTIGTGMYEEVACLALQPDGRILVGGTFRTVGGFARTNLARLNPDGSVDPTFNVSTEEAVYCLLVLKNGDILVGGEFVEVNGLPRDHLARIGSNGVLDLAFNPDADNSVWELAEQPDGRILMVGEFNKVNGVSHAKIARLNPDGSVDDTFHPMTTGWTFSVLVQPDRKVVVGGVFTEMNGQPRLRLARLHPDGSLDSAFSPAANSFVYKLGLQRDGRILVGGAFSTLAGGTRNRLGRLNADGTLDTAFNASTTNDSMFVESVWSLVPQPDGKLLVGGSFTNLAGHTRNRIARLYSDGSLDDNFAPKAGPPEVLALATRPDGRFVVGGFFTNLNGQSRFGLGQLRVDGTLDAGMNFAGNGYVGSLAVQADGKVLAGVYASQLTLPPHFLMRFQADGTFDNTFTNDANWVVNCLAVQADGKTLVGGYFTQFAGQPRRYLVRLNADGSLDTSFNPQPSDGVFTVAVQSDQRILVGGSFTNLAGQTCYYLGRLHPDGTLDTTFHADTFSFVFTVALQANGQILARGGFEGAGPDFYREFVRLNQDGSQDTNFLVDPYLIPASILVQTDGKILLGGQFTNIAGASLRHLARLNTDGLLDTNYTPQALRLNSSGDDSVWALVGMSDGKTLVGGAFDHLAGEVRPGLGRLTSGGPAWQVLTMNESGSEIQWKRSGTSPEVDFVTFEISDDGSNYVLLGRATRQSGGWQLTGLSLPEGKLFYVRARGRTVGGYLNGSSGLLESVAQFWRLPPPFLSNAQMLGGGVFQFSFTNTNVVAFDVLAATNVTAPASAWQSLGAPVAVGGGLYQFTDPGAANQARRFYKLRSP